MRQRNMNTQRVAVGLIAVAAIVGGSVVALSNRKDRTPLLGNSGATLAKVNGEPLIPGPRVKFSLAKARVHPGRARRPVSFYEAPTMGPGGMSGSRRTIRVRVTNTSQRQPNAPTVSLPGERPVLRVARCTRSDPAPPSLATIWRNADGLQWKKVAIPGVPPHSLITGLTNGRSFGKPELLVASARTLTVDSNAFALFSGDCGRTWSMSELPLGTAKGFEYAAAVTASREGFVMVGMADGPEVDRPGIILWRSNDGRDWAATSKTRYRIRGLCAASCRCRFSMR